VSRKVFLAAAGIACSTAFYASGCRTAKSRSLPEAEYVNPALCAGCHPAIAKSYASTGMGQSFHRPRAEGTVEDYSVRNEFVHRASGRAYKMSSRDGKWFQERRQAGFAGKPANFVEMTVDYVIGSGNHARSYLHRTAEGKLVELPVTWYAEKNGYWAMSPGYDRPDPSDFRRAIYYECFFCHNAYPAAGAVGDEEPIFAEPIPDGIDCQRCHGPGSAHVAAATSRAQPEAIRKAIVNPARLDRRQQLEVCMQCHLQTTAIHSPDSIRRYGRGPFSYRPGQPLGDFAVYFDFASPGDRFEIDHAAYRLAQSACFQKSQMTCTTCHNPHEVSRGTDAVARYEAVCRNCHGSAHREATGAARPAFAHCLACHMPKRRAQDVVHAVMTDHYIRRQKPAGDLLAPLAEVHDAALAYRGDVAVYDPARLASGDAELYRAVAQARQRANPEVGIASLQGAIERFHPQDAEPYFELGRAFRNAGKLDQAIPWLETALQHRSSYRAAGRELGAALADSGQLARAAQILEKFPRDAGALADLGNVYLQQGSLDQAELVLHQAIAIDPGLAAAHNILGLVRARKGDQQGAEGAFREAVRVQPDLIEAQVNLGNLLASSGDLRQALFHLQVAVSGDPSNTEAHFDLAEALAASGRFAEAQQQLESTLRLNPKHARAHADLGRILGMKGLNADAEGHLRKAVELQRDLYEAQFQLGQMLAARGDLQEARSHFEIAAQSPDPRLREAATRMR